MYEVLDAETIEADRFHVVIEQVRKNDVQKKFSYMQIRPGICVVPFVDERHVIVLKEYRHAIRSWQYEFPCGMIDDGETPYEAAKRELLEETGYQAVGLEELGFTYPSFGSTTEKIYLFAAQCEKIKEMQPEDLEEIEMEIITTDELEALIRSNEMACAAAEIAWLKWKLAK